MLDVKIDTVRCKARLSERTWHLESLVYPIESLPDFGQGDVMYTPQAAQDMSLHQIEELLEEIGRFQLIQAKLADMYVTANAARAYVYAVARACDDGRVTREDAAGAILYAAERATWMALETIQCLGGNGYINDFPAGRLLRDAKLYEIGAGTSEIRRMLIGREIFEKTR